MKVISKMINSSENSFIYPNVCNHDCKEEYYYFTYFQALWEICLANVCDCKKVLLREFELVTYKTKKEGKIDER